MLRRIDGDRGRNRHSDRDPMVQESPRHAGVARDITDQDVSDAYIYLLGRLLITRQQQVDFDQEGFQWNELLHRRPGQVDWPNPNLDVAYSEAWIALDEKSCLLVTVPRLAADIIRSSSSTAGARRSQTSTSAVIPITRTACSPSASKATTSRFPPMRNAWTYPRG